MTAPQESIHGEERLGSMMGGRYVILETLGIGGMAAVFNAYDTRLERNVAIKMILPSRQHSNLFRERFAVEARSLAALSHSNIVKVLDYGEENGVPFLVMEYIQGGTLKELTGRPVPFDQAAAILAPVARALEYVHQQNIIHRDVKPSNILLTDRDAPMLSDFGVIHLIEEEEMDEEMVAATVGIGTPDYMSPEQGMGHPVDLRADIYALGVVFFELVTGQKPFTAETPMAVVIQHVTGEFPTPQKMGVDLPPVVHDVIRRAVAKDPKQRFEDMGLFASALEEIARGKKMSERAVRRLLKPRPSPLALARKRLALRGAALLAVLALILVAGWASAYWGLWRPPLQVAGVRATPTPHAAAFLESTAVSAGTSTPTPSPSASPTTAPTFTPTSIPATPTLGLVFKDTLTPTPTVDKAAVARSASRIALIGTPLPRGGNTTKMELVGIWGIGASQQLQYDIEGGRIFQATSQGVFVYDAKSLERLYFIPTTVWVEVIAFPPDGGLLYIGLRDGQVLVYDAQTYTYNDTVAYKNPPAEDLKGQKSARVQSFAFSKDGVYMAIGYDNGAIRFQERESKSELSILLFYQYRSASGLYFSDDNRYLYAAKDDPVVNRWDLVSGKATELYPLPGPVSILLPSPDGKWLWMGGAGGAAYIYSLEKDELIYTYMGQGAGVTALAFSPGQEFLAIGLRNGKINLYAYPSEGDFANIQRPVGLLAGHPTDDAITSLAFSPDGKELISSSFKEGLLVWDPASQTQARSLGQSRPAVTKMTFTADDAWLLVENANHTVDIWDVEQSRLVKTYDGLIPDGKLFSWKDRFIILAREGKNTWEDGQILLIRYDTGELLRDPLPGYRHGWMVSLSEDNALFVSGQNTGKQALIWDTSTWEKLDFDGGPQAGCGHYYTPKPERKLLTIIWDRGIRFSKDNNITNLCAKKPDFAQPVALSPNGKTALYLLNREGSLWSWSMDEKSLVDQQNHKTYATFPSPDAIFLGYAPDSKGYLWVENEETVLSQDAGFQIADWKSFRYRGAMSSGEHSLVALGSQFGTITIYRR